MSVAVSAISVISMDFHALDVYTNAHRVSLDEKPPNMLKKKKNANKRRYEGKIIANVHSSKYEPY